MAVAHSEVGLFSDNQDLLSDNIFNDGGPGATVDGLISKEATSLIHWMPETPTGCWRTVASARIW